MINYITAKDSPMQGACKSDLKLLESMTGTKLTIKTNEGENNMTPCEEFQAYLDKIRSDAAKAAVAEEKQRADEASQRADEASQRADEASQRADEAAQRAKASIRSSVQNFIKTGISVEVISSCMNLPIEEVNAIAAGMNA